MSEDWPSMIAASKAATKDNRVLAEVVRERSRKRCGMSDVDQEMTPADWLRATSAWVEQKEWSLVDPERLEEHADLIEAQAKEIERLRGLLREMKELIPQWEKLKADVEGLSKALGAKDMRERAAKCAREYAATPLCPECPPAERAKAGLDYEAGAIDTALAIEVAIRKLEV